MDTMPRPRPPHLHRQVTRHGKPVWYVRINKGLRIRLRAEFGSAEFDAEYQAAISGTARPQKCAPAAGMLAWLLARYRETTVWSTLSPATRRQRENIFLHVIETAGQKPFARIDAAAIRAGRERRAATPAQARNFLDAMRGLFRWATKAGLVKIDRLIRPLASRTRHDVRATASGRGLRTMWPHMSGTGRLGPDSGCG